MQKKLKILILEDNKNDAILMIEMIRNENFQVDSKIVETEEHFIEQLESFKPDIVLSDYFLPQFDGIKALEIIKKSSPEIPFILVTGYLDEITAVNSIKNGVWDYVLKDHLQHLVPAIQNALKLKTERQKKMQVIQELTDRDEMLRSMMENIKGVFTIYDWYPDDHREIVFHGSGLEEIVGKKLADKIGGDLSEYFKLIPAKDAEKLEIAAREAIETNKNLEFEYRLKISKDEYKWVKVRYHMYPLDNGVIRWQGMLFDVTEKKKAEEELKESELMMRTLFNAMQEIVFEIDLDGKYVNIAPTNEKLFFKGRNEMLGKSLHEVLPLEVADKILTKIVESLSQKKMTKVVYQLHINNKDNWFEAMISPKTKNTVIIVAADITKRKKGEILNDVMYKISKEALNTNNLEEFSSIVHKILSNFMNTDNFYVAIYDKKIDKYYFPFHIDELEDLETQEYYSLKNTLTDYIRKTGKSLFATEEKENELREKENIKLYGASSPLWIGAPIIDLKSLETLGVIALQSYNNSECYTEEDLETLEFIAKNIGSIIEKKTIEQDLRMSNERLKLFTKILRHDLTNDFVAINSALRLNMKYKEGDFLEQATKKTQHGIDLIRRMGEQEKFSLSNKNLIILNLKSVFESIIKRFPQIDITISGTDSVFADNTIYSIFNNIISNAINHGKATKVNIEINSKDSNCTIRISNNGEKISTNISSQIFEEGYKSGKSGNTGMGLYIIQKTMQYYKGTIFLDDMSKEVTSFILIFKRAIVK